MLLFRFAALFGIATGLPRPDAAPDLSVIERQPPCSDGASCTLSSGPFLADTQLQGVHEKRQAYSDDVDSVTVTLHVSDSYFAGTDFRIFFAFGDAESTFGSFWSQISTIWDFKDRGVHQHNNILKVFDGPSRGDRADVKFDLKKGFGKDRVSISDLRNISLAVLPPSKDSIGEQVSADWGTVFEGGFKIQEITITAHHAALNRDFKNKQFSDLNKWLNPTKLRWVKDSGEIVWKGELELEKWLDQDQKPLSIDEPSRGEGTCPRFSGKGARIGKRQNNDNNQEEEWDVWGAFEEAQKHLEANTQGTVTHTDSEITKGWQSQMNFGTSHSRSFRSYEGKDGIRGPNPRGRCV
ncbi:hypothetical protein EYZ11_009280 [Aspergillus tanneri]|uniref:Uncharacterized protein n=1 Tax=Aspergillus tanneri TaxID=1220188 RepID=A0A4S3JDS0_9EURO|nr:hypothetical protein EYZ11_009280 [Aspergillus tanneri]